MKILINHIDNTLNYGSAMMAINLIYNLEVGLPNHYELFCEADSFNFARLKSATGSNKIKQFVPQHQSKLSGFDKIKKYILGSHSSISRITNNFDFLIVLGGDDLSETYKKAAILRGTVYRSINKKCKVILAGQSFGPFRGITKNLARILYKDITIISRDENSYLFTKLIGIKKIFRSRDLALLPLPNQDRFGLEVSKKFPFLKDEYITCVPSGLWKKYHNNRTEYIDTWVKFIEGLSEKFFKQKIVLLAHVLMPEHANDVKIIDDILLKLNPAILGKTFKICDPLQPAEARSVLGGSFLILTGRMHAAVSSYFMNKPVISLAYSEKYSGVIGTGLDLADFIIDTRSKNWGNKSEIIAEVEDKLELILNGNEALKTRIKVKVDECSKMVHDQINFIINEIEAI